ncbi:MAG: hypothetical protein IJY90_03265 [Clostridia bacterium]|nr:hypothetical protein [Clostridia bacterium]
MKKKIFAFVLSFALIFGMSIFFAGCNSSTTAVVTIDFNNDVDSNQQITVEKGQTIELPDGTTITPPHQYLEFDYWCTNTGLIFEEFEETCVITKSITIYAKWKIHENYNYAQVVSQSMSASGINAGDYIIYKYLSDEDVIELNDIVMIEHNSQLQLRHIYQIIDNGDGSYSYKTKASSNATEDYWTSTRHDVVGLYQETIENPEQYLKYIGAL